jgi:hypothetical protein
VKFRYLATQYAHLTVQSLYLKRVKGCPKYNCIDHRRSLDQLIFILSINANIRLTTFFIFIYSLLEDSYLYIISLQQCSLYINLQFSIYINLHTYERFVFLQKKKRVL